MADTSGIYPPMAPMAAYPVHHQPAAYGMHAGYGGAGGVVPGYAGPADARPAPLGRRSPPPVTRRYNARGRSPSPSDANSYAMSDTDAGGRGAYGARRGYASDYNSGYESGGGRHGG